MDVFFLLYLVAPVCVYISFIGFLLNGKQVFSRILLAVIELFALIVLPLTYAGFGNENNCCGEEINSTAFSPDHQLTIGVIILIALTGYGYSSLRKKLAPPVAEALVNLSLVLGIVFNIVMYFHVKTGVLNVIGTFPILALFIMRLIQNHRLFVAQSEEMAENPQSLWQRMAWTILTYKPIIKYPVLLLLCLPLLLVLTILLLLFGQKPDSVIRAFTDTYHHGLSQWDYKCDNITCGGHYLCSVAANGHPHIVKPVRTGTRLGGRIICNRQLLISNAFEELLQEKLPRTHKAIRHQYNKAGHFIHRYYGIFNNKIVADSIYYAMKPLEWFFLFTLYLFDRKPENRIAKQYLSSIDRQAIDLALPYHQIITGNK